MIQSGAAISADATTRGNGGKVIVWANERTDFHGFISAKGGAQGGNGGFVETSGKQILSSTGLVDASSAWGLAGQWLLDPNNITIQTAGGNTNVSAGPVFTSNNDGAIVTTGSIETALNAGTNVTISTGTGGTNGEAGNITVSNTISKTAGAAATLTLNAANSIFVNANISSTGNALGVLLNADADSSGYGAIRVNGATIDTRGGDITLTGGLGYARGTAANVHGIDINNSTLNAGGGNITLSGHATNLNGNNTYGVNFSGATVSTTGTGAINVTGVGGGNNTGVDNIGIVLVNTNTLSTVDGDITMTGTGGNTAQWGYGFTMQNNTRIQSTGAGSIDIDGTGGTNGTTHSHFGVHMNVNNTYGIFTNTGDIAITGQGTGGGTVSGGHGVYLQAGSVGSSSTGDVSVTGTATATSTGNDNYGVYLTNAASIYSTGGDIDVTGTGGAQTTTYGFGVYMAGTANIQNTTGGITVNANGGGRGVSFNHNGLYMQNSSAITTTNGNITINATAGSGTQYNAGLEMQSASRIASSGTGDITINATGGSGNDVGEHGIYINTTQGITTQDGDLDITATSLGTGIARLSTGMYLNAGNVGSNGTGNVTVDATGAAGTGGSNHGIIVTNNAPLYASGGNISVTGRGGLGQDTNYGILINGTATIRSTGNGTVDITGIGGGASNGLDNIGIYMDNSSVFSSVNGDLSVTGTGGSGRGSSYGMWMRGSSRIAASGTGDVTLTGTGGTNGTSSGASGVMLHASGGAHGVYTNSGNLLITGTGTGTGASFNNNGIYILNQTVGTTSGAITLNGTGGTGTGLGNNGIRLEVGTITGGGAAVQLTGTGGTGGSDSNGVVLYTNSNVTNTGAGSIAITGTGNAAATSTGNHGVRVNNGSVVSTVNGTNTISGAAGGGTNGAGVIVDAGHIRSSGTGVVTVRGTLNTAGESAIRTSGNGRIGSGTQTANIVLAANSVTLDGTDVITTGNITYRPYADGATLGVGAGAGTSQISDTMIGRLNGGSLTFGDRATGAVTINTARTYSQLATFISAFGSGNNITLSSALNSNLNNGPAFVIASGRNFVNNAGAAPFVTSGARGLVYTVNNSGNTLGAWAPDFTRYSSTYTGYAPGSVIEAGNGLLVASSGNNSDTIRFTADNVSRTYGNANPAFTYTFFCSTGCTQGVSTTGAPALATAADANSSVGNYGINITQNTLALASGYEGFVFDFVAGTLGVNARPLTINVDDKSKVEGAADPTFTGNVTGLTAHDSGLGTTFNYHPVWYLGSAGTYTIVADAVDPSNRLGNYSVTTNNGTFTVTAAPGSTISGMSSSGPGSSGGISQIINSVTPPPPSSTGTSGGGMSSTTGGGSYGGDSGNGSSGGGNSGSSGGQNNGNNNNGGSNNGGNGNSGNGNADDADSDNGNGNGGGNATPLPGMTAGGDMREKKQESSTEIDESLKALMERLKGFFQLSFDPSLPKLLDIIRKDK